jgi:hypothetical protein
MERPGLRHRLRGSQPLGLSGLFVGRLAYAHIFGDGGQYFGRMVAQLLFAHIRVGRHERFSEGGEFADDFPIVVPDERAKRH